MADSIEQIKADFMAEQPDAVHAAVRQQAEEFIEQAILCARRMLMLKDPWQAQRILVDATIWMQEFKGRVDVELSVKQKPKATSESFKR